MEILLNHDADIEAKSERTKDTPLSLACSGGRYVSQSLAAIDGYTNIIKLLLFHCAEINLWTGSKMGISPLMLATMNGHVKLLLNMGYDINAQTETNRSTALVGGLPAARLKCQRGAPRQDWPDAPHGGGQWRLHRGGPRPARQGRAPTWSCCCPGASRWSGA